MNENYILRENRAFVFSDNYLDNRDLRIEKYTTNLDEKLIQENKIELMEKEVEKCQKIIDVFPRKKTAIDREFINELVFWPMFGISCYYLGLCIDDRVVKILDVNVPLSFIAASITTLVMDIEAFFKRYEKHKSLRKKLIASKFILRCLKNNILLEQEKLLSLNSGEKMMSYHGNFEIKLVKDGDMRKKFKLYLNMLKYYGESYRKYLRKLIKGKGEFPEKIKKEMLDDGLDIALYQSFLEEELYEDVRKHCL